MGNVSEKSEYAGYDSYDESELSGEEDGSLEKSVNDSLKKLTDDSLKKLTDDSLEKPIDDVEKGQDIVDNVFDSFEVILDEHRRLAEETFDEIERVILERYREKEIDMSDSIVLLFKTESPMDLL